MNKTQKLVKRLRKTAGEVKSGRTDGVATFFAESTSHNHYTLNFNAAIARVRLDTAYEGLWNESEFSKTFEDVRVIPVPAHGSSVRGVRIEYKLKPGYHYRDAFAVAAAAVGGPSRPSEAYEW